MLKWNKHLFGSYISYKTNKTGIKHKVKSTRQYSKLLPFMYDEYTFWKTIYLTFLGNPTYILIILSLKEINRITMISLNYWHKVYIICLLAGTNL